MAQRSKAYFLAKFITNYIVQHQDMTDLADSALFYSDDVGYDIYGAVWINPPFALTSLNFNGFAMKKMPNYEGQDPSTADFTHNNLDSYVFPSSFISMISVDFTDNPLTSLTFGTALGSLTDLTLIQTLFTSLTIPANLVSLLNLLISDTLINTLIINSACTALVSIDGTSSPISSASIPASCVNLTTLIFLNCNLSDFTSQAAWTLIASVNLSGNSLTALGIEHVLVGLASSGTAVTVNVAGGTNASHTTWTAAALSAETTIGVNGGSVIFNP